ncbi:MAG: hypothetical protein LBO20_10010 [Bifidobacteriaceae bacterium]|jgi:hypothetical protein|nr:hypothetical protein [Bifidobacteriaceae bacterium]
MFVQFREAAPWPPEARSFDDRKGWLSHSRTIQTRAARLGYSRGRDIDASWFESWVRDVPAAGVRISIGFTGPPLPEEQVAAAITELTFEPLGGGPALALGQVPPVLAAEAHHDYVEVAEAGAFDPDWERQTGP